MRAVGRAQEREPVTAVCGRNPQWGPGSMRNADKQRVRGAAKTISLRGAARC